MNLSRTTQLGLLAVALLTALLAGYAAAPAQAASPGASARATPTKAQLTSRADTLMHTMSLAQFLRVKGGAKTGIDAYFNWKDDGCSGPPNPYADDFHDACLRHDFGFRNYGNGLHLDPTEPARLRINNRLRTDTGNQCAAQGGHASCSTAVGVYYHFVNDLNNGSKAFYDDSCDTGHICLYDDDDRSGWRVQLAARTATFTDFAGGDLNDNVKSVWNRTSSAWRVFENSGYSGTSTCVGAGKVDDFGRFDHLNDELSSARPWC